MKTFHKLGLPVGKTALIELAIPALPVINRHSHGKGIKIIKYTFSSFIKTDSGIERSAKVYLS